MTTNEQSDTGVLRPHGCHGCGRPRAVNPDSPAPFETSFGVYDEIDGGVIYECDRCGTHTRVPADADPGDGSQEFTNPMEGCR